MLGAVAGFHDPAQDLPRIFSELVNFLIEIGVWSQKVNGSLLAVSDMRVHGNRPYGSSALFT
jgi:hypothetical protein